MRKSQKQQVLEWLQKGWTLTPYQALRKFHSLRLGAIIFELRKEGYNITTMPFQVDKHTIVAKYRMVF